jgi:hypothetical protein
MDAVLGYRSSPVKLGMVRSLAFLSAFLGSAEAGDKAKLADLAEHALAQSQLTYPNSRAFHLQAVIAETSNPKSEYQAKIEQFWVSPKKYRRIIEAPGFAQTLIRNGDQVYEKNVGDYYPWWLNEFVTAIFDPLSPMGDTLKQSGAEIPKPGAGGMSEACSDLRTRTDRWVVCFDSRGLLESVFMKGYSVQFKDYQRFRDKQVARTLEDDPEPGTHLKAKIVSLVELTNADENLFAVTRTTPPVDQIKTVRIDEDAVRKIATGSTEIDWPSTGEGLTTGGCAVYISADRNGQVREVWPEGCDNPGLQDPLREQVRKWRLKPAVSDGVPVQINSLLTFTFHSALDKSKALPTLSDAEVRKLAFYTVDAAFPPGTESKRKQVAINISLDETGKLAGAGPAEDTPNELFIAAYAAVSRWRFHPYLLDGKPQYVHARLVIPVK